MTKRRRPSTPCLSMQIAILFSRFEIVCGLCGERIEKPEDAEWDHIHEHADGGAHNIQNLRPVHGRRTDDTLKCHQRKSAKAVTQRAKIDRLEEQRVEPAATTRARKIPRRPMQSRGFQKPPAGYRHSWGKRAFRKYEGRS